MIFGSVVALLGYSFERTDYLVAVGALVRFLPFALDCLLLFFGIRAFRLTCAPRLNLQCYPFKFYRRNVRLGSGAESLTRSKSGLHYPR
jgi:hypothetical protein